MKVKTEFNTASRSVIERAHPRAVSINSYWINIGVHQTSRDLAIDNMIPWQHFQSIPSFLIDILSTSRSKAAFDAQTFPRRIWLFRRKN